MFRDRPFAALKFKKVDGVRMAYIDEGTGPAIVFQHGQPTSSYVWRNVMPHLEGLGRLVACDLVGMGASAKLPEYLGWDRYRYASHRDYLFGLWDELSLGSKIILVLDDWGAALGFEWARLNQSRVQGIVHMEAVAVPLEWSDLPEQAHPFFQGLRSPAGEMMVLNQNVFMEKILPGAVIRELSPAELEHYRQPYLIPGEDRRPTLSWPRSLPLAGEPVEVVKVVTDSAAWMSQTEMPKLLISGEPGTLVRGRVRDEVLRWPNQTEVVVKGRKILQEDSPDEIGAAIATFVRRLRSLPETK